FGEHDIKTVEDLAGSVTDELIGWTERKREKDAEPVRHKGVLEGVEIGRKEAEDIIMAARIAAGWVTAEDLEKLRAEQEAAAAAAQAAAATPGPAAAVAAGAQAGWRWLAGANGQVVSAEDRQDPHLNPQPERLRQCARSRRRKSPDELIRFVAAPDGTIVPDLARRLPGRGVWITATRADLAAAVRDKAFHKSLRAAVVVPDDLLARVETLLQRRLAEAISLARKAGLLIAGFAKVEELIDRGQADLLVHAADAAGDGVAKL